MNKSLLAMIEKEEADVPPMKSLFIREKLAGGEPDEKLVRNIPQSLVSIKEESNRVNDLKNSSGPGKKELRLVTKQALQQFWFHLVPIPLNARDALITTGADSRFEHFDASKIFYTDPCHHDLRNASPSLNMILAESPALSLSAHIYHLTQSNQYGEAIYLFANMLA
ncbi:hypothetical protein LINPERPRIM_LOCUS6520 [Linum perenne]